MRRFRASSLKLSSVMLLGICPSRRVSNCFELVVYCGHFGSLEPVLGFKLFTKWMR